MKKDFIIVGQGIAGSVLSFLLMQCGKTVLVIDENKAFTASKVAAGLYNPIVFKRIVKSWMVDEVLPAANQIYAEMEQLFKLKFHHKRSIVKLFVSEEERAFWLTKATQPELAPYLTNATDAQYMLEEIQNNFSCAFVKQSGNVDIPVMLEGMKEYLIREGAYKQEQFDFNDLKLTNESVTWKDVEAQKIIFCEGYHATKNPYFNYLPFLLTKGEVLIIRIKNYNTENVVNKGVFIMPLGNDLYKVGATYEWNDLTEFPSEKGKSDLLSKLQQVLKIPFEIVEHQAGIRPTVKDRRPLLGIHPKHAQIGIFNGMGTKAILLAPYFAQQYVAFLEAKSELHPEVDIKRYAALLKD